MADITTRETSGGGATVKGSPLTNAEVDTNFINLNDDKVEVSGAIIFEAKAAEALSKGDVVYVSGVSGNTPEVSKADANDASKMPAYGLAETNASLNAAVNVVTFGTLYDLDTSGFSAGDTVYVSTAAGGLTNSAPAGESSLIQNIGMVVRSHASAGSIKVGGAGRTNATPNLDDGNVFIGNASNQVEARALTGDDISGGTITSFASTGIDDNATSTAITIDSSENTTFAGTITSGDITVADSTPFIRLQDSDGTNQYTQISNVNGNGYIGARNDAADAILVVGGYGEGTFTEWARWSNTGNLTQKNNLLVQGSFTSLGIDDNATSTAITINSSRNVGIGTDDPDSNVHIAGSAAASLRLERNDTTIGTGNGIGQIHFEHQETGYEGICATLSVESGNNNGNGEFVFKNGIAGTVTEKMRIDRNGNVGIGTTDPSDGKLQIAASATAGVFVRDSSGSNAAPYIRVQGQRQDGNGSESFSGGLALEHYRTDAAISDNKALGTVYFGGNHTDGSESNIAYGASIVGKAEGTFNSASDMPTGLAFFTGSTGRDLGTANVDFGTERMRIDASGNVGIGTDSPASTAKLSISDASIAAISIDNTSGRPYELISTSTGNFGLLDRDAVSYRMLVDSSGNVGIGTTSPASYANASELVVDTGLAGGITVVSDSTAGGYGALYFADGTTGDQQYRGFFQYNHNNTGTDEMLIGTAGATRMTIDSSGNVGIGTTSPIAHLNVNADGSPAAVYGVANFAGGTSADTYVTISRGGADQGGIKILRGSVADMSIYVNSAENSVIQYNGGDTGDHLLFRSGSAGTERVRFDSSGNVTISDGDLLFANGHGIDFSATGQASGMSSELLDDYEEGTWTPYLNSGTAGTANGTYTKIGRQVFVNAQILDISDYTSTTNVQVLGLPFTSASGHFAVGPVMYRNLNNSSLTDLTSYIASSDSHFLFYVSQNDGTLWELLQFADFDSGLGDLYLSLSYFV